VWSGIISKSNDILRLSKSVTFFLFLSRRVFYSLNIFRGQVVMVFLKISLEKYNGHTRWFKYDRDKLWVVNTQNDPVKFEPPCKCGWVSLMFARDSSSSHEQLTYYSCTVKASVNRPLQRLLSIAVTCNVQLKAIRTVNFTTNHSYQHFTSTTGHVIKLPMTVVRTASSSPSATWTLSNCFYVFCISGLPMSQKWSANE
jgi:hypothetical protein